MRTIIDFYKSVYELCCEDKEYRMQIITSHTSLLVALISLFVAMGCHF